MKPTTNKVTGNHLSRDGKMHQKHGNNSKIKKRKSERKGNYLETKSKKTCVQISVGGSMFDVSEACTSSKSNSTHSQLKVMHHSWEVTPSLEIGKNTKKSSKYAEKNSNMKFSLKTQRKQGFLTRKAKQGQYPVKSACELTTDLQTSLGGANMRYSKDKYNASPPPVELSESDEKKEVSLIPGEKQHTEKCSVDIQQYTKNKVTNKNLRENLNDSNFGLKSLKPSLNSKGECNIQYKNKLKCSETSKRICDASALTYQKALETSIDKNVTKTTNELLNTTNSFDLKTTDKGNVDFKKTKQNMKRHRNVSDIETDNLDCKKKRRKKKRKKNNNYIESVNCVIQQSPSKINNVDFEENISCFYHIKNTNITNKICAYCTNLTSLENSILRSKRQPHSHSNETENTGASPTCVDVNKDSNTPFIKNDTLELSTSSVEKILEKDKNGQADKLAKINDLLDNTIEINSLNQGTKNNCYNQDNMEVNELNCNYDQSKSDIGEINQLTFNDITVTVNDKDNITDVKHEPEFVSKAVNNVSSSSLQTLSDESAILNKNSSYLSLKERLKHDYTLDAIKRYCTNKNQQVLYLYLSPKKADEEQGSDQTNFEKECICNEIVDGPSKSNFGNEKGSLCNASVEKGMIALNTPIPSECVVTVTSNNQVLNACLGSNKKDSLATDDENKSRNKETAVCVILQTEDENCSYLHVVQKYIIQNSELNKSEGEIAETNIMDYCTVGPLNEGANNSGMNSTPYSDSKENYGGSTFCEGDSDMPLLTTNFSEYPCKINIVNIMPESENNMLNDCSSPSASESSTYMFNYSEKTIKIKDDCKITPEDHTLTDDNLSDKKTSDDSTSNKEKEAIGTNDISVTLHSGGCSKKSSDESVDSSFTFKKPKVILTDQCNSPETVEGVGTKGLDTVAKGKPLKKVKTIKKKCKSMNTHQSSTKNKPKISDNGISASVVLSESEKSSDNNDNKKDCKSEQNDECKIGSIVEEIASPKTANNEMILPDDRLDIVETASQKALDKDHEVNLELDSTLCSGGFLKEHEHLFSSTPYDCGKSEMSDIKVAVEEKVNLKDKHKLNKARKIREEGKCDDNIGNVASSSSNIRYKHRNTIEDHFTDEEMGELSDNQTATGYKGEHRYRLRNTPMRKSQLKQDEATTVNCSGLAMSEESTTFDEVLEITEQHLKLKPNEEELQALKDLSIEITWDLPLLHVLDTGSVKITFANLRSKLGGQQDELDTSCFKKDEEKRIRKNWTSFSKKYNFTDPQIFMPSSQLYGYFKYAERRKFKQWLARGLPHRRLSTVYRKFADIFSVKTKAKWTRKEDELLMSLYYTYENSNKHKKQLIGMPRHKLLCRVLGRNYMNIHRRLQHLQKNNFFTDFVEWSPELEGKLVSVLMRSAGAASVEALRRGCSVDWEGVAARVGVARDCALGHWRYRLHPQLFATAPVSRNRLHRTLVNWLYYSGVKDWGEINWKELSKKCCDLGPYFLLVTLKTLVADFVPREKQRRLRAAVSYLKNECLKSSSDDIMLRRVRYDATNRVVEEIQSDLTSEAASTSNN